MVRDWSSVRYPAWWTRRAQQRRELLGAAVERLRAVVLASPDIVGALVFGSYVQGNVGPDSDLDVTLITTLAADGDPGLRHARLAQRLALAVPCDLLVYEPAEFERLVRERSFVAQAYRDGLWIDATAPA